MTRIELRDKVSQALLDDNRTAEYPIEVQNSNGIITISGTVQNRSAYQAAEEIAKEVEGVIKVINEIHIGDEKTADEDKVIYPMPADRQKGAPVVPVSMEKKRDEDK